MNCYLNCRKVLLVLFSSVHFRTCNLLEQKTWISTFFFCLSTEDEYTLLSPLLTYLYINIYIYISMFHCFLPVFSPSSCIDEWFEVNRSCPEHPSDWSISPHRFAPPLAAPLAPPVFRSPFFAFLSFCLTLLSFQPAAAADGDVEPGGWGGGGKKRRTLTTVIIETLPPPPPPPPT